MNLGHFTTIGWWGGLLIGGSSLLTLKTPVINNPVSVDSPRTSQPVAIAPTSSRQAESADARDHATSADTSELTAERALQAKVKMLKKGQQFLESIPGYTVKFTKQEVVRGELLAEQSMLLKYRRQPFSLYLCWLTGDTGREVLYIAGTQEGRMLAHDGGWKARLPSILLAPHATLAMHDTRYPVTDAGFQGLIALMLKAHQHDFDGLRLASCVAEHDMTFQGRKCSVFTTQYQSPDVSPVYRKSITLIDQEWNIPVKSLHFDWPTESTALAADVDAATLLESYEFSDFDFSQPPTDEDFSRENPAYHFR